MAKKKQQVADGKPDFSFLPVDENGFHRLTPKPGGRYDRFQKLFTGIKLPKDSDKFLYDLVDTYGAKEVVNLMEVDIGNYVYSKGINHALNINVGRSIPWIQDGLKSGERRVLYTMWQMGLYGGKHVKVAVVVGRMIETVYPHGDQAPAEIVYRLGRNKTNMIPCTVAGGNFGNMEDQKPAAPRYAWTALTNYAMDCFFKEIGPRAALYDEKDNYDFSGKEPVYLVARYPNILMQWNQGIGKGASSWLGAFNSKDIFKAAITMLDDPYAPINIYPDLPVPTPIINKRDLRGCFDKAKFKVKMQAPYDVIVDKKRDENGKIVDKYILVFTSLPLTVNGSMIKKQIQALKQQDQNSAKKQFPELLDVLPVATPDTPGGIRLVVEYEKGYDPHALAEKLYRRTSLSKTIGVQYKLIVDNHTAKYTPRQILNSWLELRYDQKRRYYNQLVLQAAKDRAVYEALCTILSSKDATDKAIKIIRGSNNDTESIDNLRKEFGFTEFQATMVLQIRLKTLSRMNVRDVEQKRDKAIEDYKTYRKILTKDGAIKEVIRQDLIEGMEKYGKQRIAPLMNVEETTAETDKEYKWIFYNQENYYCASTADGIKAFHDKLDHSYQLLKIRNADEAVLIDRKGYIKIVNGYSFSLTDQPIDLSKFGLDLITKILPAEPENVEKNHVVLITRDGYGKVMEYKECVKHNKGRLLVFQNGTDDELADIIPVSYADPENDIIAMSTGSQMIYTKLTTFPKLKRLSTGNFITKGMKSPNINRAFYISSSSDYLMIYGESGYVKFISTDYLVFKRKVSAIPMANKTIVGIVSMNTNDTKEKFDMYDCNGHKTVMVGKPKNSKVEFMTSTGESQSFKIATSIGNPIKVFKKNKNEFYKIL